VFRYHVFKTALGWMGVAARAGRLTRVILPEGSRARVLRRIEEVSPGATAARDDLLREAARQLALYAEGTRTRFDLPLDLAGLSDFRRRVMQACMAIPFGEFRTYGDLAAAAGSPGAARAVGQVMHRNPLPIIVPCHRVVGAGGHLVGFSASGGLRLKRRLLIHEGVPLHGGKVVFSGPATAMVEGL
jgi:methylated-DNA-[protein]-cysteine S-methyltransferase